MSNAETIAKYIGGLIEYAREHGAKGVEFDNFTRVVLYRNGHEVDNVVINFRKAEVYADAELTIPDEYYVEWHNGYVFLECEGEKLEIAEDSDGKDFLTYAKYTAHCFNHDDANEFMRLLLAHIFDVDVCKALGGMAKARIERLEIGEDFAKWVCEDM